MGRKNRRTPQGQSAVARDGLQLTGFRRVEPAADGDWIVQHVRARHPDAEDAKRQFRCPGCQQIVPATLPHIVAWPTEGTLLDPDPVTRRRHWHTPCWSARGRRRS